MQVRLISVMGLNLVRINKFLISSRVTSENGVDDYYPFAQLPECFPIDNVFDTQSYRFTISNSMELIFIILTVLIGLSSTGTNLNFVIYASCQNSTNSTAVPSHRQQRKTTRINHEVHPVNPVHRTKTALNVQRLSHFPLHHRSIRPEAQFAAG